MMVIIVMTEPVGDVVGGHAGEENLRHGGGEGRGREILRRHEGYAGGWGDRSGWLWM